MSAPTLLTCGVRPSYVSIRLIASSVSSAALNATLLPSAPASGERMVEDR
jgi:hypothetical protein